MSILSFEFLIFVAAVLLLTYALPIRARWISLTAASCIFVVCSGWQSVAHLSAIVLVTWLGGMGLAAVRNKSLLQRRLLLALLLVLDIGAMAFVKYAPAVAAWLNDLAAGKLPALPVWELAAPLGLSYFTFQTAGLLIDVYRGKAEPLRNPFKVWLFAGYFPQLAQGPISTWKELGNQLLTGHRLAPVQIVSGFQLMLWGYFKKLVIADRLVPMTTALLTDEPVPGWLAFGGLLFYAVRLYADFSGGMDVVRGVSRMLGIELPENFRRPFFSQSIAEYWRRWHITLGAWFRSCLMYPLTTSRFGIGLGHSASRLLGKKAGRVLPTALATLLVFLLIGIWHTANWNALVYGGYFGIIMALSMLLEPVWKTINRTLNLPKGGWMRFFRLLRTWLLVMAAQAFAFTASPRQGFSILSQVFGGWSFSDFAQRMTAIMETREWIILGTALLVLLAVDLLCERKVNVCERIAKAPIWVRWPLLLALILSICVFGVYGAGFDGAAFVYAQF